MQTHKAILERYRQLNTVAGRGGAVLFGSTFAANIPVGELKQSFELDRDLYNRSFADLSVFEAEPLLRSCVLCLSPDMLLLQLGETDLAGGRTVSEIVAAYEALVSAVRHEDHKLKIILVSVCADGAEELNRQLQTVAKRQSCDYADISDAAANKVPCVKAFSLLKRFLRGRLTEYDALNMRCC